VPEVPGRGDPRRTYPRPVLTLHWDVTAPAAALAVLRCQRLADAGRPVAFSGIDVLGVEAALPVTLDQLAGLEAAAAPAAALGLELRRPTRRVPTLPVHLVGSLAEAADLGAAWRLAVLRAYWTDGADVADAGVLTTLAVGIGLDAAAVTALLDDRGAAADLRGRFLALRRRGVGGVPVLEVDGTLLPADVDDATLRELAAL
jgi:2-hydroxychromene-2-carboxylate isomerase